MSKARDELMHVLFTTAIEGGINYWAEVSVYHWRKPDTLDTDDLLGFHATIHDVADGVDGPTYTVNRGVIVKGYDLAATTWRRRLAWSTEPPPLVVVDDMWDFDAGDADMILQLGLFGDVTYG